MFIGAFKYQYWNLEKIHLICFPHSAVCTDTVGLVAHSRSNERRTGEFNERKSGNATAVLCLTLCCFLSLLMLSLFGSLEAFTRSSLSYLLCNRIDECPATDTSLYK